MSVHGLSVSVRISIDKIADGLSSPAELALGLDERSLILAPPLLK
jgi:hypothetical protein